MSGLTAEAVTACRRAATTSASTLGRSISRWPVVPVPRRRRAPSRANRLLPMHCHGGCLPALAGAPFFGLHWREKEEAVRHVPHRLRPPLIQENDLPWTA